MKQPNRYCGRICTALLCVMFLVIWGNSALSGDTSGDISGGIMAWLTELVGGPLSFGELVLRKLAHFTEFMLLGLLLAWRFLLWGQKGIHRFTMPLLCGNLAPRGHFLAMLMPTIFLSSPESSCPQTRPA